MADYEVRIVNKSGVPYDVFSPADVGLGRYYRELNNWGSFDFTISTTHSRVSSIRLLEREVQVWRNGRCAWWGIPVSAHADKDWLHVQCYGLEWYLNRRLFGPIQTNYVANGSFESGLANWTAVGCTATLDTSWKVKGTQSVRLTTSTAGQDSYLSQFISVSGNPDQPVAYKASAVYRIDPTATWNGPPLYERGLYIARLVGGVVQGDDYVWEPITEDTQRDGSEVFVESPEVSVPAGQTQTIEIRLYCPSTTINWDLASVKVQESVSTAIGGEDVAVLLQRVIEYAQHGTGKSDLNFGFASTSTGRHLPLRAYQFYDHGNVWEAIQEFTSSSACDVGVVWNANGTERTFMVWGWPGRGSIKSEPQFDISAGGHVAEMSYDVDGTQTSTKVRALGQGEGATREVGEATDTSSTGGLVLESSIDTPLETLVGALDSWASAELSRAKAPVKTPRLKTHENAGSVIDAVDLGDVVPVVVDYGWVQENDTRRIVGISIDPTSDTVEPTFN